MNCLTPAWPRSAPLHRGRDRHELDVVVHERDHPVDVLTGRGDEELLDDLDVLQKGAPRQGLVTSLSDRKFTFVRNASEAHEGGGPMATTSTLDPAASSRLASDFQGTADLPRGRRLRRGTQGLQRHDRPPPGPDRPLCRRQGRGQGGRLRAPGGRAWSRFAAAATTPAASECATTGS